MGGKDPLQPIYDYFAFLVHHKTVNFFVEKEVASVYHFSHNIVYSK